MAGRFPRLGRSNPVISMHAAASSAISLFLMLGVLPRCCREPLRFLATSTENAAITATRTIPAATMAGVYDLAWLFFSASRLPGVAMVSSFRVCAPSACACADSDCCRVSASASAEEPRSVFPSDSSKVMVPALMRLFSSMIEIPVSRALSDTGRNPRRWSSSYLACVLVRGPDGVDSLVGKGIAIAGRSVGTYIGGERAIVGPGEHGSLHIDREVLGVGQIEREPMLAQSVVRQLASRIDVEREDQCWLPFRMENSNMIL